MNNMNVEPNEDEPAEVQTESQPEYPNGAAAAAILAAAIGCFSIGIFGCLGDAFPALGQAFDFYHRTGPLSGVTTTSIVVWLIAWLILYRKWAGTTLRMRYVNIAAFLILAVGLLLTFPPFSDALQSK
jgi:hypothetical protein